MKAKFYLAMAASALLMTNCSQEEEMNGALQGNVKTLTATIEGASRSTVTDGGVFSWAIGDEISVWNGSDAFVTWVNTNDNVFGLPEGSTETTATAVDYAIYPANESHKYESNTVKVNLPASYGDIDTEYAADTHAPMLATIASGSTDLAFKHLGGLMRFIVKDVPTSVTTFKFKANKAITGEFTVTESDGNKVISAGDSEATTANEVTITFKAGTEARDMTFYVPMPVGTYGNYTVTVGEKSHESTNVTNTVARRSLLLMPTYTYTDSGLTKSTDKSVALGSGEQDLSVSGSNEQVVVEAGDDASAVLNLDITPAASNESTSVTISDGSSDDATASDSKATVKVTAPTDQTVDELTINAPTLTVELTSGSYETITAKTATQTLIIGEGVTVGKLTLNGGNVKLNGNVTIHNVIIPTGLEIAVDLNGKTLTAESTDGADYGIDNQGTLTVKNGTIQMTDGSGSTDYAIVNREGATVTLDNCDVVGSVFNVGTMTVGNGSDLKATAENRAALICGDDAKDIAWTFNMDGGTITSEKHSAAVLKNNYYQLTPQGLGTFANVTFSGAMHDVVLAAVNVKMTDCTLTNDNVWLAAKNYVSYVNGIATKKENLQPCKWADIYTSTITTADALTTAFSNAATDGTSTAIVLGGAIELTSDIAIAAGKNITLDLNGYTLTTKSTDGADYGIDNQGTLIVQNGTLQMTDGSGSTDYVIVNREGATVTLDNCDINGSVFNVGTMTVGNGSDLKATAENRAALICGSDTEDIAWTFTMNGGTITSEKHSAAVLKNNYYQLTPQGLGTFTNVTFSGAMHDIVLAAVNVKMTGCTLTNDNVWLAAKDYVSYVNDTATKQENLQPCKWEEIFPASEE